jgi:FPC/CPF motif-containing protein YcgG
LRALIHDPEFPCLGAKSVVNEASYRFGLYAKMACEETTSSLAADLLRFIDERPSIEGEFSTFIACFIGPKTCTPEEFEQALWLQLAALHEVDRTHHPWSDAVSDDPSGPDFGFSFGGHPFFVVGLSPASERWARRFPWPTLVFNDHAQFERLRAEHRFDRLRKLIRDRDTQLHGSVNEMLGDFGAHSEARQYAGRQVSALWRCPVDFQHKDGDV